MRVLYEVIPDITEILSVTVKFNFELPSVLAVKRSKDFVIKFVHVTIFSVA